MATQNDNLVIDGAEDEVQLTVQGHSTQTNPLQEWEKSDGTPVAKLHEDARLQIGDEPAMATPATLIEAHRNDTLDTNPPQVTSADQGLHTSAYIENEGGDANIEWSVHEVTLDGDNTNLGRVAALRAGVTNQGNGTVDEAVGLEIADITGATDNYAIKTGQGVAQFGDALELGEIATPVAPASGLRLYTKSDKKLYMRPAGGSEQEVGSGGAVSGAANQVFATPDGASGDASLRPLVADDLSQPGSEPMALFRGANGALNWRFPYGYLLQDKTPLSGNSSFQFNFSQWAGSPYNFSQILFVITNCMAINATATQVMSITNSTGGTYSSQYFYTANAAPPNYGGSIYPGVGMGGFNVAHSLTPNYNKSDGYILFTNPYEVGAYKHVIQKSNYSNGVNNINIDIMGSYSDGSTEAALALVTFSVPGYLFDITYSVYGIR